MINDTSSAIFSGMDYKVAQAPDFDMDLEVDDIVVEVEGLHIVADIVVGVSRTAGLVEERNRKADSAEAPRLA